MPRLTHRHAALIAAAAATLAYVLALSNGYAGDDLVAVRDNPAAHSVARALASWFEPYWPGEWQWAGLYRPLTILSYAIDWSIADGAAWWAHLVNVVLHAAASGLVVAVLSPWLPPIGTLAAGVLFALHPVHVEAVANIVGRAELLVALALLGALLTARRYRRAGSGAARRAWGAAVLVLVLVALFSKEHGIIAIAVLGVDHLLDCRRAPDRMVSLYVAVSAITIGWLYLWRHIAGAFVAAGAHAALSPLTWSERVATMAPVYLDVLRLLVWPMRLLSDYAPQTVPVRLELGWVGCLGLASAAAIVALGVLARRRNAAIAIGILLAVLSYAPTSNLLVVSGVMLAERNLYLAVLAPAAAAGWLATWARNRPEWRIVLTGLVVVSSTFAYKTLDRIPVWHDSLTLVLEERVAQPGNYHNHVQLSDLYAARGDTARAIAERLVAAALFPEQPLPRVEAAGLALATGRPRLALEQVRSAAAVGLSDPRIDETLIRALLANGMVDSAVATGAAAAMRFPGSPEVLRAYGSALETEGAGDQLVLLRLRLEWLERRFIVVQATLDSLADEALTPGDLDVTCGDIAGVRTPIDAVRADVWDALIRASACESLEGS